MKTHTIKTPKAELLIVEAKDDNIAWAIVFQKYGARAVVDYTILGKPDEIREDESLFSLIESEIYWENPLGEKPIWNAHELQCTGYFSYMQGLKRWKEAKSRTFDRNRCLILYKQLKHK